MIPLKQDYDIDPVEDADGFEEQCDFCDADIPENEIFYEILLTDDVYTGEGEQGEVEILDELTITLSCKQQECRLKLASIVFMLMSYSAIDNLIKGGKIDPSFPVNSEKSAFVDMNTPFSCWSTCDICDSNSLHSISLIFHQNYSDDGSISVIDAIGLLEFCSSTDLCTNTLWYMIKQVEALGILTQIDVEHYMRKREVLIA